jgi:hypothetical protein
MIQAIKRMIFAPPRKPRPSSLGKVPVWSGVKIFFGGCIVLPILLFVLFAAYTATAVSGSG